MSKLTIESGQAIAEENLERIYHLPKRYTNLDEYLSGSLRETLLSVLNYIKDKRLIIENHKYLFFLDTTRLTTKVRKKTGGRATSNRHINLLCALGLLGKEPQNEYRDQLIEINKIFLSKHPSAKRPINVFIVRRYTDEYLEKCEERARRLNSQHIRTGNMCSNILIVHGLEDIAEEVYQNNKLAPGVKKEDYQKLLGHMKAVVERQGYITKQQIFEAMDWSMKYLEQVRRIFKQDLAKVFKYYSPTNQQMKEYNLKSRKYIYTKRG